MQLAALGRIWHSGMVALLVFGLTVALQVKQATAAPAFLVLAPDRGFLGNEEVRDVFERFRNQVPHAVLAFATDEQTDANLQRALAMLEQEGGSPSEVVVLPLFLSEHDMLYQKARSVLQKQPGIRFAPPLGQSYLAEEILFDRVAALLPQGGGAPRGGHGMHGSGTHSPAHTGKGRLVLVAGGAGSEADEAAIKADVEPLVRRAVGKFGLTEGEIVVLYESGAPMEQAAFERHMSLIRQAGKQGRVLVVPFNLSTRMTTMMSAWSGVQRRLQEVDSVVYDGEGIVPHPNVERWLVRTANAYLPITKDEIGVILVPHGADYNWNEAMREAMAPIRERYVTEDAFSMVDPYVVERAVRRLEEQGMKAAVLVRIFSLESSFQEQAEYILGLRPDYRGPHADRISSSLRFATVGGLEAHPYLAEAMLDRAREISRDPRKETVILVAHGTGSDEANAHWMDNMASIAAYIKAQGEPFRAVKYHTWREDWPDKREAAVQAIRAMVEEASRDGGTALVLPVRTIGQGPEETYLEGLEYRHGTGFAPHPGFVKWLEAMIEDGMTILMNPDGAYRAEG